MINLDVDMLKLVCWNVQSLCNKIHIILQVLHDEKIDIACIQETWLSSESNLITSIIKQAGFNICHVFRSEKRGAGVAIIWRERLQSITQLCKIKTKTYGSFQYQCMVFNLKPKLLIISIYRLQEISFTQFLIDLEDLLSNHFSNSHSFILLGDFNTWFEKTELRDNILLSDLMSSFGLSQLVTGPTHRAGHTLDLIFLNNFEVQTAVPTPIDTCVGDHFPVYLELHDVKKCTNLPAHRQNYRNLSGINLVEFASDLCSQLDNLNGLDFPSHYEKFSSITNETLSRHAPLKTKTVSAKKPVPWQDADYRSERALRRKYEREWKKSVTKNGKSSGPERDVYVQQRKKCANLATSKRSQYYSKLIQNTDGDQGSLYKIVSNILDKNKSTVTLPQCDKPAELANRFNTFYTDKVQNIREKIPIIDSTAMLEDGRKPFAGVRLEVFSPITVEELKKLIQGKTVKTAYNDILPRPLMRKLLDTLLPYICNLINVSIATGSMEGVKEATIVPLLKKAGLDPEVLKNYRPVSDIVLISKLIETVVLDQFNKHTSRNNLQCPFQHGYKKFHNTETLLLRVVNDILIGFDSNTGTILLLLDLSAAFDTVDIDKLLNILETDFGITGIALKWFNSFLTNRKQKVRIHGSLSDYIDVLFGVPQGSVLGPVLFNLYAQSLYKVISAAGFNTSGYADDSNARLTFALTFQHNVVTQQLPNLMERITQWMNQFFLKINPDKTEIILFIPQSLRHHPTINGTFFSNGTCIRFSDTATNLGVKLDKFLTFEPYVNSTVALCYKQLKDISSIRQLIETKQTEMLVHSVISNRLDYCNSLLFGLNKSVIEKFQKVQNAAARVVLKLRKRDPIRQEMAQLHWLRVSDRVTFKILMLTFKCIHNMAPVELKSLITFRSIDRCTLNLVFLDSTHGRRTFKYAAPRLWNSLPSEIRKITVISNFKSKLKHLLFNNSAEFMRSVNRYL